MALFYPPKVAVLGRSFLGEKSSVPETLPSGQALRPLVRAPLGNVGSYYFCVTLLGQGVSWETCSIEAESFMRK